MQLGRRSLFSHVTAVVNMYEVPATVPACRTERHPAQKTNAEMELVRPCCTNCKPTKSPGLSCGSVCGGCV